MEVIIKDPTDGLKMVSLNPKVNIIAELELQMP
jgi:hypothetical protein